MTIEPETTACPCCAGALHRIGEDFNDVVDRVPAVLRILRTIRPKYACRACEGAVVQAKARPRLIESGMASTALVAWIAAAKFAWGSTLYRQAQILGGHGLRVDRQTLARWMKQAAWTVKGLYELQLATMHGYARLFCDETPVWMLDPGRGRTKLCQFWAHATDDRSWKGPAPPAVAYKRCHAELGLRSDPWPNNRADEENQLQRVSFPARDHSPSNMALPPVHPQPA